MKKNEKGIKSPFRGRREWNCKLYGCKFRIRAQQVSRRFILCIWKPPGITDLLPESIPIVDALKA